jgi:hypothetical protein
MVTHADTEPDGHPVQKHGRRQDFPAEDEERGDGPDMQQEENDAGQPVEFVTVGKDDWFGTH